MTLLELYKEIKKTIESVKEDGRSPENIQISIQIDNMIGTSIWSTEINVMYDNDCQVSGCVIFGEKEE